LHGSANAIGGRSEVLKLRWGGHTADDLRFPDAPQGIKFALGENVKRSNSRGRGGQSRFPGTRMGVEGVFDRAFMRTREYQREWAEFEEARARGEDPAPPRRDVRLDVLAGILTGDVIVHSHCYRADEILMLLRVADRYGFRIATLQHVLEGYKVAAEIAAHGAGTSTFSDWWAYKIEAYDAIPQNAALLDEAVVVSTINSDSGELVRHLYLEAAKSVKYAGLDPVRTLALATLNGAIQLRIEDRVGSIEVGKDADLVLLDGDPLSIFSKVLWTMVDGEIEFTRIDAFGLDEIIERVEQIEESIVIEASYDPDGGRTIAITGGTIHPVTGREIENGTIVIQGDRIVDVGRRVPIPVGAEVIDATGRHVWPGIIALNTPLGLREIGSIRATTDDREGGGNQPDLRVSAALHPDSAHIPVTRANGITRAQTAPQGGGPLMGQSAVIRTTGDTWEELLHVDRDMLHVQFPSTSNRAEKKEEPEAVKEMKELLAESREYGRLQHDSERTGSPMPPYDPRLEALVPYARGEKPVALHVSNAQTILFAIKLAQEEELDAILFGCKEGWKVVDAIAESGLSVVVGPVLSLPSSRYDPYDACYANAAVLHRAGVPIALMSDDSGNPRNVSFHAGMAVAFGLPHEEAVRCITYYAAEILGLEDELGSLQVGKIADIVVTDGDLLEATTRVTDMLIDGVPQSLDNKHSQLYERYRERLHTVQESGKK
ncbi:MAG: amidohydrolase family protein, partial [Planctomycetota bacterium]|nr:amidohydrolase family protein [Planctomycetota bacterium]